MHALLRRIGRANARLRRARARGVSKPRIDRARPNVIGVIAAERLPRLSQTVVYEKVCLYSNTPDEDFVIDAIPNLPNAFVFSACSGHGFKFTPLMGEIAARLATEQETGYDLTRFQLGRFAL